MSYGGKIGGIIGTTMVLKGLSEVNKKNKLIKKTITKKKSKRRTK